MFSVAIFLQKYSSKWWVFKVPHQSVITLYLVETHASENKYISESTILNICILPCSEQLITILMVWKICFSISKCSYKWEDCEKYWDIIINFKGEIQQILRIYAKKSQVPNYMADVWLDSPRRIFTPSQISSSCNLLRKGTYWKYREFRDVKCRIKFSICKLNWLQQRE